MNFETFRHTFSGNQMITLDDILIRFPDIDRKILTRWVSSKKLIHLRRGMYMLPWIEADNHWREQCANALVTPSYISLEYALSLYGLIPEEVITLTSITTKKTQSCSLEKYGRYTYRSIIPRAFTGYKLLTDKSVSITCATPSKSIVDYLYFHPDYKNEEDFTEWRIHREIVKEACSREELRTMAKIFLNKRLTTQVENFISYIWS